jgi:hypothetical protein
MKPPANAVIRVVTNRCRDDEARKSGIMAQTPPGSESEPVGGLPRIDDYPYASRGNVQGRARSRINPKFSQRFR